MKKPLGKKKEKRKIDSQKIAKFPTYLVAGKVRDLVNHCNRQEKINNVHREVAVWQANYDQCQEKHRVQQNTLSGKNSQQVAGKIIGPASYMVNDFVKLQLRGKDNSFMKCGK